MALPSFTQYDPYIDAAAKRFGVDPRLIRGAMALENYGGDPSLTGSSGEVGLMQVMGPTYAALAKQHGLGTDRSDPSNNIMAGTAYLREGLDAGGGDWGKALAYYNAGPGGSAQFRKTGDAATLPAVTQAHLQRAARFGLIDPTQAPPVNVASRAPVQTMTSTTGQSVDTANGVSAMPETAAPPGLLSTGDAAPANSGAWAGLLGNGMAQGQALMALASGLMSGRNMGEGLTRGLQGFGGALQNAKAMQMAQLDFAKKAQQQAQMELLAKQYDGSNPKLAALIRSGNEAALNSIASNLVPKRGETPWYVSTDDNGKPQANPQALNTYAATKQAENGLMLGPNGFQLPPGVADATREKSMSESTGQQAGRAAYAGQIAGAEEAAKAPYRVEQVGPGGTLVSPFPAQGQPAGGVVYQNPNPAPGTQEGSFTATVGRAAGEDIYKSRDAAAAAADVLRNNEILSGLLDKGVITGTGANFRLSMQKALATAGLASPEKAANTEAFISQIGKDTLSLVKNLGAGSGISNADRDYAERIAGGNVDMTEQGIRRIMDINRRAASSLIDRHNGRVDQVVGDKPGQINATVGSQLRVGKPSSALSDDDILSKLGLK